VYSGHRVRTSSATRELLVRVVVGEWRDGRAAPVSSTLRRPEVRFAAALLILVLLSLSRKRPLLPARGTRVRVMLTHVRCAVSICHPPMHSPASVVEGLLNQGHASPQSMGAKG